ncbi:MAG: ABC transporter permease [Hyphomicrobiales bacterium]|nr:ABC transporter permease [Hyphomicrobiales bacterium]MCY4049813.1 ABC transporter permease [Hyphomicrobiales bacterium]
MSRVSDFFAEFIRRNGVTISVYLFTAVIFWIAVLIILPQLYMLDFSFRFNLPPSKIGTEEDVRTLKNYQYLLFGAEGNPNAFNWLHLEVFFRTIWAAVLVTILNLVICYPIAYYMTQVASGGKARILILCLILPFWVNEILRAFAFRILFGLNGPINFALINLGIVSEPVEFIKADVALYTGLAYAYVLLMIFPLYNAIESLDHNQVDAARDLGSPWWRIHWRVVIPHAKPGIASGCTMVFMLTAGALAAPQILGGPSSLWFTQVIYQWFYTGGNWPQGAAYAFVLLTACIVFVLAMMRVFRVSLGEIAK